MQSACCLRGKTQGRKKQSILLLMLYCCKCTLNDDHSDEHINILINSLINDFGFKQRDSNRTLFGQTLASGSK